MTVERAMSTHATTPSVISNPYLSGIFMLSHKEAQNVQIRESFPGRFDSSLRIVPVGCPCEGQ